MKHSLANGSIVSEFLSEPPSERFSLESMCARLASADGDFSPTSATQYEAVIRRLRASQMSKSATAGASADSNPQTLEVRAKNR